MAQGYWGPDPATCRCCNPGPKVKFYCQPCDHVCKAPVHGHPLCPFCRQPMTDMGHGWRPGKKGRRSMRFSRPWAAENWRIARRPEGFLLLERLSQPAGRTRRQT